MRIKFLLFSGICTLLIACGPSINDQQWKQLKQLTKDVDSVHHIISQVDSSEILEIIKGFKERRNYIINEMSDTLSPETIFYLDTFLVMKKSILFFESQYFPILEESSIMKAQIKDLTTDASNRLIEEERFQSYYELEQDNFMKLLNVSEAISRKYNIINRKYYNMLPKVDSIISATRKEPNV